MGIKQLYQEMAELTLDKCKQCKPSLSCCSPEYCEMALEIAKEKGEELNTTNHPTLPLMGEHGCIAPPHLRPLCTMHVCEKHYMHDTDFGKKYFSLRDKICESEYKEENNPILG